MAIATTTSHRISVEPSPLSGERPKSCSMKRAMQLEKQFYALPGCAQFKHVYPSPENWKKQCFPH